MQKFCFQAGKDKREEMGEEKAKVYHQCIQVNSRFTWPIGSERQESVLNCLWKNCLKEHKARWLSGVLAFEFRRSGDGFCDCQRHCSDSMRFWIRK